MEETQNKRKLRRSKKLLDAAARDALVEKPKPLHNRLIPADALTLDQQHLIDDGSGEYSFRLCFPSCSLGAFLHTVYLMSVNGQGSDESHGRWQDYTHTQHRQRG